MQVVFCPLCYLELEEYGIACEVWENLCLSMVAEEGVLVMDPSDFLSIWPVIEFLEKKGYLITTDVEDDLYLLKPVGMSTNEEGDPWICKKGNCPH